MIEAESGGLLFCSDQRREVGALQHSGLNPWTQFHANAVRCKLLLNWEIKNEILVKKRVRSTMQKVAVCEATIYLQRHCDGYCSNLRQCTDDFEPAFSGPRNGLF